MESNKKFTHSVLLITCTNLIRFMANIAVTLIIPNILGKSDYGNYKTYTLYITYLVIFNFGLIEGIYLKYGGQDYDNLNKEKFRTYTRFLFVLEVIISLIVFFICNLFLEGDIKIVLTFLSLNILSVEFTTYFQRISQVTSKFSKQGIFDLFYSLSILIIVGIVYFFHISSYKIYLTMITIMNYLILIWYIVNYWNIVKGKATGFKNEKNEILKLMSLGIPLMLANFASEFILNMDRQVVNIFFSKEDYATYAFSYNFLNVINVLIQAISLVLYPFLKKMDINNIKKNYSNSNSMMLIIVYFCLIAYFPLTKIINWLLPTYVDSIKILKIIFPISVFTSSITVIKHNYYKVLEKNNIYFVKTIIMLVISLIANFVSYFIFKTMESISIASIITMFLWYIDTEIYLIKHYKIYYLKNLVYLCLMLLIYYICVCIFSNIYMGFFIYGLLFFLISYILFPNLIKESLKKIFTIHKKDENNIEH